MKTIAKILLSIALLAGPMTAALAAHADDTCASDGVTCQLLFVLQTNAIQETDSNGNSQDMVCQFYTQETSSGLSGLWTSCNDGENATSVTIAQIEAGVVMKKSGSHHVISLQSDDGFTTTAGGPLTMTYLTNGALNASKDKYATYPLAVQFTGSEWIALDKENEPFISMFMEAKKDFFGIVTGIANIATSDSVESP